MSSGVEDGGCLEESGGVREAIKGKGNMKC